jgi:hypothetical protein
MIKLSQLSVSERHTFTQNILTRLRLEFGTLPENGVLAGQAVASAIYEELGILDYGVYNDLDVFHEESENPVAIRELFAEFKRVDIYRRCLEKNYVKDQMDWFSDNESEQRASRQKEQDGIKEILKNQSFDMGEKFEVLDYLAHIGHNARLLEHAEKRQSMRKGFSRGRGAQLSINTSASFGTTVQMYLRPNYAIIDSYVPMNNVRLNYVQVRFGGGGNQWCDGTSWLRTDREPRGLTIVENFDFNMLQVGIDLDDDSLHFTADFDQFLQEKTIRTCFLGTPMHSAIRLINKCNAFPEFSCDIEKELYALKTMRQVFYDVEYTPVRLKQRHQKAYGIPSSLFGGLYVERFNACTALHRHFSLEPRSVYIPRSVCEETGENECEELVFQVLKVEGNYCQKTTERVRLLFDQVARTFDEVAIEYFLDVAEKLYILQQQGTKKAARLLAFIDDVTPYIKGQQQYRFMMDRWLSDNHYAVTGLQGEGLKRYCAMVDKHPTAMSIIKDATVQQQIRAVKRMRWLEKNRMGYVIGLLENETQSLSLRDLFLGDDEIAFREVMAKHDEAKRENMDANSVRPLIPDAVLRTMLPDLTVKELCSEYDLYIEGEVQKHCVGGYFAKLRSRESLILSLSSPSGEASTLELSLNRSAMSLVLQKNARGMASDTPRDDFPMNVVQYQGRQNRPPSDEHTVLKDRLVKQLNLASVLSQIMDALEVHDETVGKIEPFFVADQHAFNTV